MRCIAMVVGSAALLGAGIYMEAQSSPPKPAPVMVKTESPIPAKPKPLLPNAFSGWVAVQAPKIVTDPAEADSANVTALKEYDFVSVTLGQLQEGRETLSLHALSFQDLSGAYGAYSFYRQNGWPKADIGSGAVSDKNRVLFWQGNTVIDATFSQIGPMSAAELREVAGQLPVPEETGRCHPRSWPACRRIRWRSRRRITRLDRQAMQEGAACCRQTWSDSIAVLRP